MKSVPLHNWFLMSSSVFAMVVLLVPNVVLGYVQGSYYAQGYYQTYYQSYYQSGYSTTFSGAVSVTGDVFVNGAIAKGSGTFVIDHPLDPVNKLLFHSFVESPDVKNLYDGIATLDANGEATVVLPEYFEVLNTDFRYQVKAISAPGPNLYIKQEITNNQFVIAGGTPGVNVSWQVTGIRQDPYILANPIIPEVEKGPDQIADKGEFLFEGYIKEYGGTVADFIVNGNVLPTESNVEPTTVVGEQKPGLLKRWWESFISFLKWL